MYNRKEALRKQINSMEPTNSLLDELIRLPDSEKASMLHAAEELLRELESEDDRTFERPSYKHLLRFFAFSDTTSVSSLLTSMLGEVMLSKLPQDSNEKISSARARLIAICGALRA